MCLILFYSNFDNKNERLNIMNAVNAKYCKNRTKWNEKCSVDSFMNYNEDFVASHHSLVDEMVSKSAQLISFCVQH